MNTEVAVVFAEKSAAYGELCGAAQSLGARPTAFSLGGDAEAIAAFGARVLSWGDLPEGTMLEDSVPLLEREIRAEDPQIVLMQSSKRAQCIAGRLAVRLGAVVVNGVLSIERDGDSLLLTHVVYGGMAKQVERVSGMVFALIPSGAFEAADAGGQGTVEQRAAAVESGPIKLVGTKEKQEEIVDLSAAKRVVCVGRGIGNQGNLRLAEELAGKFDAEMACTRPIAESEGWMARSRYVGVSGASVKPDVYLALGVSGQVQHMVGALDSRIIAVVNKDKNAPCFKNCDIGLVADVEKVLPVLESLL